MKRNGLLIIILFLFSCTNRHSESLEQTSCEVEKQQALEEYAQGEIHYVDWNYPRYEGELKGLLEERGIHYESNHFGHRGECYKHIMDSLISKKHGANFMDKMNEIADSIFFERRKNGIFQDYQVDTWPLRKGSDYQLGGEFIINHLNSRLPSGLSYRFVSNIVDRPHYIIEFTVTRNGETENTKVAEDNNSSPFSEAADLITSEVNKIGSWIPPTIKGQPITATFEMGVAIEENK